jgi:hypothetical protein
MPAPVRARSSLMSFVDIAFVVIRRLRSNGG